MTYCQRTGLSIIYHRSILSIIVYDNLKKIKETMTRKQARQLLPIIKAYAEGKTIQYSIRGLGKWVDVNVLQSVSSRLYEYRVKPSPKYRPFANAEECWSEMQKHQPFGWVKGKKLRTFVGIFEVSKDGCELSAFDKYEALFNDYTFTDGTPFGIKAEREGQPIHD